MKGERITISVSGAAEVAHCGPDVISKAKELGREIARQGAQIITGATSGFPMYSAEGAKEAGDITWVARYLLERIGEKYGLTRERVRQIKERTLERLKSKGLTRSLKDY